MWLHIEWKRRLSILGIAAGVYAGYKYLLPAAVPFLAAWTLASWLSPITAKIEERTGIRKNITGTAALLVLFAFAGTLLYFGAAELFSQIRTAAAHFPEAAAHGRRLLDDCCTALERSTGIRTEDSRGFLLAQMDAVQENFLTSAGTDTFAAVFSGAKKVMLLGAGVMMTFITTLLMLGDMENIRRKIWDYSWLVGTRRVFRRLRKTTVTYLKAQLLIIAAVSAVCAVGFWLMGSPYFLIMGIGLAVFDAVPIIGTGTFLYPAALILLLRGKDAAALGCVILDILTSLLRELLEPRLLGAKLGVSPLMVLASVYFGMLLFGGWGVLLGPLSFSTAFEIGREWDVWG